MYPQLPQEEDPNVLIDAEIERRLFDREFTFRELDENQSQYNYEMMPYISPDELLNNE
jgi:hypothetical protein